MQRPFEQLAPSNYRDLGSHMPLGSWILLRGSEKKAIISQLAEVYDLNADLTEVAQQQIPDKARGLPA